METEPYKQTAKPGIESYYLGIYISSFNTTLYWMKRNAFYMTLKILDLALDKYNASQFGELLVKLLVPITPK
ncbi:unnamed protein product [Medioppia subpectinata]|uniref:Uncharacterized protein n=1 Tax=Medioppia subpectinata TaxID=1979941 RepID=A0A7R9PUC7_9ACAR|nr:unnamed protein product [Medioppia subpectinata]CAG2100647.1 unnamed protein product [Medioppia subpectinata]